MTTLSKCYLLRFFKDIFFISHNVCWLCLPDDTFVTYEYIWYVFPKDLKNHFFPICRQKKVHFLISGIKLYLIKNRLNPIKTDWINSNRKILSVGIFFSLIFFFLFEHFESINKHKIKRFFFLFCTNISKFYILSFYKVQYVLMKKICQEPVSHSVDFAYLE